MRTCPECHVELVTTESKGVEVDVCEKCGGIFLDAGEFDELVAKRFRGGPVEAFLDETARAPAGCRQCGRATESASCPDCGAAIVLDCPVDAEPMYEVIFDDLEVDRCPQCRGIWIDPADRSALRRATEAEAPHESRAPESQLEPVRLSETAQVVTCGGCGATAQRRTCIRRMDAYWCEHCVVEGNYPGGHGPPVSRRLAEAARAMADQQEYVHRRKERAAKIKQRRETFRVVRGKQVQGTGLGHAIADAVESTARSLRELFRRRK